MRLAFAIFVWTYKVAHELAQIEKELKKHKDGSDIEPSLCFLLVNERK